MHECELVWRHYLSGLPAKESYFYIHLILFKHDMIVKFVKLLEIQAIFLRPHFLKK